MALMKPAGTWTYEDLFSLPDDGRRYEIIEGELFEMPPPNLAHATVIANLIALLLPLVKALGGRWYTAPVGVFIAGTNPVEPDIVVLLPSGTARREHRGIEGPPDLVIEVLSPSNPSHANTGS
jgi:Uma2 family endonuclease